MEGKIEASAIYELLFETATEGFIVANSKGEIKLANEKVAEIFGYNTDELKTMVVDDLLPKHLRSKHVSHRTTYVKNPHKRPMGTGMDLIGVRKDGSSVPIEISLNHYKDGDEVMVMALIMDVTVRKEQEAQIMLLNQSLEKRVEQRTRELNDSQQLYRSIARNFPNGTINVFDKDFNYIFVEGQDLYKQGVTSESLVGKSYLKQLHKEVRDQMEDRLQAVLEGQNLSFELSHEDQHYLINMVGLSDNQGTIDRILLVEQNITARIHAEQRMKQSFEKEKQLNELKSRFVSMASHEFRTPLSTVLSSLSLIEKYDQAGIQEKKPKHYQRIRGSVRHLTSILNDFLSLEKVEAGKVSVHKAMIPVHSLMKEMVEQHQQMAKPGQVIHLDCQGRSEVYSDQNMLRVIVSNLMSNAIKYSLENQSIWVRISANDKIMKISVQDEGMGIPSEDQQHMFERFFRAKNAINLEGTGLGLNIVQRYTHLLGGSISFESVPMEGATFYIEIPIKDDNA